MHEELPPGALDIVGDIHGELEALLCLLAHLGYDTHGLHPEGRRLVFVGDLCDRGPDSPGVMDLVRGIVEAGRGQAVVGNHELNLLRSQRKDGNDWFWDEASPKDSKYEPFERARADRQQALLAFMESLPLTLTRHDLRIVHAAWHQPSLDAIGPAGSASVFQHFQRLEPLAEAAVTAGGRAAHAAVETSTWAHALHDPAADVPMLQAVGTCEELRQMANPIRALTSGVERKGTVPFFSSGKWRFVERVKWWDEYHDDIPVVVGHYWRRMQPLDRARIGKADPDLFEGLQPTAWHGHKRNVFCVDYSVGGRFRERLDGDRPGAATKLAALRWPERTLVLDTGEVLATHAGA